MDNGSRACRHFIMLEKRTVLYLMQSVSGGTDNGIVKYNNIVVGIRYLMNSFEGLVPSLEYTYIYIYMAPHYGVKPCSTTMSPGQACSEIAYTCRRVIKIIGTNLLCIFNTTYIPYNSRNIMDIIHQYHIINPLLISTNHLY